MTVGVADLKDPGVRRLVQPGRLPVLEAGPHAATVVRVKDVPVAVAAASIGSSRAELLSLGCVSGAWATPAPGWAVSDLRRRTASLVYEPAQPLPAHIAGALRAAGMRPSGQVWSWYEFHTEEAARRRDEVTTSLPVARLDEANPVGYQHHPDDRGDSPVLLEAGVPVAYCVLRRGDEAVEIHWAYVESSARRRGLVIELTAAIVDALGSSPARFRVAMNNAAMRHVLEPFSPTIVGHLWDVPTWV